MSYHTHNKPSNRHHKEEDSESSYDSQSQQQVDDDREYEDQDEEEMLDDEEEMLDDEEENVEELERKKQQLLELEEKRIKAELKEISFGELLRYKNLKEEVGSGKAVTKQIKKERSKKQAPSEKKDKNAPREIKIMKRPQKNKIKQIFTSDKPKSIDPRFEDYAGSYNQDLATKSYSFINDIRNNEVTYIKKELKNKKLNEENRQVLLKNYNKITSDMKKFEHQQIERKVKSEFKSKPFNPKKSLIREHVQKAKLDAMDDRSQDKRLKKKEKKIQKQKFLQKKQFMSSRK